MSCPRPICHLPEPVGSEGGNEIRKAAVHVSFSVNARVIDYVYKNNSVHAYWDCTNGSGNPWVCIGSCKVTEDEISGRWVYRNYLR